MKRICLIVSLMIVLFGSVLVLDLVTWTPTVQAQTDPNAPTAPNTVYLPLIAGYTKKSGIHMGNRNTDWQDTFLQRIQPPPVGAADGKWPAAVVIQSDQVYQVMRPISPDPANKNERCRVNGATVKQTNGQDYAVYDYLTRAISRTNGTIVVIRITPSPGNFSDYDHLGKKHNLLATEIPAGDNYCGDTTEAQKHKVEKYRDVYDIAAEMEAIYQVNKAHGWPLDRFYFEPANEPNYEWYQKLITVDKVLDLAPNVDNKQAWIDMDEYFAALYDQAKKLNHALQILSPSMAQRLYGEHFGLGTCDISKVEGGGQHSGLDFMKKTYGYDYATINQVPAKADGFSLHNYWQAGQETWDTRGGVSFDGYCDYEHGGIKNLPKALKPVSDHITQYFPDGMAVTMRQSGKPMLITEADLVAPCPKATTSLIRKETLSGDLIDYASLASDSLTTFIQQEFGARYVIAWLLVNEYEGSTDCDTNGEINWHEAYGENGQPRGWFTLWWPVTP
ncbi:MAG: hypothetical protein NT075_11025 [Chloroflexi bacterium]|nr:hypothetical protein [Chloroflexota bacterium]